MQKKADRNSFQQQQVQVEAVARAVNALSEEMCSQEAQKCGSEKQLQEPLDRLQEEPHGELAAFESRYVSHADTVKDPRITLIATVEKRLQLLEEELSILVAAIDKKADIESVNSDFAVHKKVIEEAIRKRCLKTAFDQEVLAIHELLRHQQMTLDARLTDTLSEMKSVIDSQVQTKLASISEIRDKKWLESQHDCEQRHARLVAEQQELLKIPQHDQLACMEEKLQAVAVDFNEIAATTKTCLAEIQSDLYETQQRQQDSLSRDQEAVKQQMKEELERQLLAWTESVSTNWNELHERVEASRPKLEVIDQVQSDLTTLKAVTENLSKDVTTSLDALEQWWQLYSEAKLGELHSQISNEVQQLALVDPAARSKQDRKLKQQIQGLGSKLAELDQMVKLVGKQLIQNTSQLQVFRKEQHVRRQLETVDELAMYTQRCLLDNTSEDLNEHVLQSSDNDRSNQRRPAAAATAAKEDMVEKAEQIEEDAMLELRSQHQDLKHAVRDKVRHYQKLLQQE